MNRHTLTGLATLPNIITLARLALVPVTLFFILQEAFLIAFWLFLLAGLSDAVDGIIARLWQLQSQLGAMLDPLADKALLVGVYITLSLVGVVPVWLVWLVVVRDVLIVAGFCLAWLWKRRMEARPSFISKVNTTVQIVLAAAALGVSGFELSLQTVIDGLVMLVAATTVASLLLYAWRWFRHILVGGEESKA